MSALITWGRRRCTPTAALLALTLAPLLVAVLHAWRAGWVPIGDHGLIELRAADVLTADHPWLGTWTSASLSAGTDLNNPGPLLFDLLAPFVKVLGGSAGTAGGLKVTTFVVLFFVIVAEVRGERDVVAFDRRIDPRAIRAATTVALLGVAAVLGATMVLTEVTELPLREALFESTSAFATVGLSMNVTAGLPPTAQFVLVGLMFLGRLGPITLVSALALRDRDRRFTLPEGAPLIG